MNWPLKKHERATRHLKKNISKAWVLVATACNTKKTRLYIEEWSKHISSLCKSVNWYHLPAPQRLLTADLSYSTNFLHLSFFLAIEQESDTKINYAHTNALMKGSNYGINSCHFKKKNQRALPLRQKIFLKKWASRCAKSTCLETQWRILCLAHSYLTNKFCGDKRWLTFKSISKKGLAQVQNMLLWALELTHFQL